MVVKQTTEEAAKKAEAQKMAIVSAPPTQTPPMISKIEALGEIKVDVTFKLAASPPLKAEQVKLH